MLARRALALSLVVAFLAAPPIARTRMFCRWTGEEIQPEHCTDAQSADGLSLASAPCCDRRVSAPLPPAKSETGDARLSVAVPVEVQLDWFEAFELPPNVPAEAPPLLRPPLSETRILLI